MTVQTVTEEKYVSNVWLNICEKFYYCINKKPLLNAAVVSFYKRKMCEPEHTFSYMSAEKL